MEPHPAFELPFSSAECSLHSQPFAFSTSNSRRSTLLISQSVSGPSTLTIPLKSKSPKPRHGMSQRVTSSNMTSPSSSATEWLGQCTAPPPWPPFASPQDDNLAFSLLRFTGPCSCRHHSVKPNEKEHPRGDLWTGYNSPREGLDLTQRFDLSPPSTLHVSSPKDPRGSADSSVIWVKQQRSSLKENSASPAPITRAHPSTHQTSSPVSNLRRTKLSLTASSLSTCSRLSSRGTQATRNPLLSARLEWSQKARNPFDASSSTPGDRTPACRAGPRT